MTAVQFFNNEHEQDLTEKNNEINEIEQEQEPNSFECVKCGMSFTEESNAYDGFTCDSCLEDKQEQEPKKINYLNEFDNLIKNDGELESFLLDIKNTIKSQVIENKINAYTANLFTNFITALEKKYNENLAKEYKKIILLESHKIELEYYFVTKTIDYIELTNTVNSGIDDFMLHQAKSAIDYIISKRQNYQANIEDLANGYVNVIELEKPKPVELEKEQVPETETKSLGNKFILTWKSKHEFEQLIKTSKILVDELTFEVNQDGLLFRTIDPSHVALVDIFYPKESFDKFEISENSKVGIRPDEMFKVLSQIDVKESLELTLKDTYENGRILQISNKEGFSFDMRTIEISSSSTPLPKLNFNAEIVMNEKGIKTLLKRSELVEYFTFKTYGAKDELVLENKSDLGTVKQLYTLRDGLELIEIKEDSTATYSMEYIVKFIKSFTSIKQNTFKFEYSSKMPIRISTNNMLGHIHFFLAPRIQD